MTYSTAGQLVGTFFPLWVWWVVRLLNGRIRGGNITDRIQDGAGMRDCKRGVVSIHN